MGIVVRCRAGHGPSTRERETIRGLARRFSETGTVGLCPARKGRCSAERAFYVTHKNPDKTEHTYDVVAVRQVYSPQKAEQVGRDPVVFLLKDQTTGEHGLWTYYWIKDRNGDWANGQFPPLFLGEEAEHLRTSINDLRRLMREKAGQ